jgi:hypothetical protein
MKSNTPKISSLFVVAFTFLLFFTGLFFNPFGVLINDKRIDNQAESIVVGRLVKSHSDGMFSKAGLCGRCNIGLNDSTLFDYQYIALKEKHSCKDYTPYYSQIGFHGVIYYLILKASPLPSTYDITVLRVFKVAMLAGVLSLIVLWFYLEFGLLAALFVAAGVVLTPWITYLGRDLWFCVWTNFLPFLTALFLLKRQSERQNLADWKILLVVNLMILLNFVINGYEWVSTTLVMASIPFFYYWLKDRWRTKKLINHLAWLISGSVASLLLTFSILAYQISLTRGKFSDGIEWIIFSFQKRAHGGGEDLPEVYEKQVSHPLYEVFLQYFSAPAFKFPDFITKHTPRYFDGILFIELIVAFMLATWFIFYRNKWLRLSLHQLQNLKALAFTTWISILAPFSWYVIFKGHAWSHHHIDYITWFMPFCLFGLAVLGAVMSSVFLNKRTS